MLLTQTLWALPKPTPKSIETNKEHQVLRYCDLLFLLALACEALFVPQEVNFCVCFARLKAGAPSQQTWQTFQTLTKNTKHNKHNKTRCNIRNLLLQTNQVSDVVADWVCSASYFTTYAGLSHIKLIVMGLQSS